MSEFLMENYIWIIVGIVLLMTIIGYIADKTDFGHKQVMKRQKKEDEKDKKIENDLSTAEKELSLTDYRTENNNLNIANNDINSNDFWGKDKAPDLTDLSNSSVEDDEVKEETSLEPIEFQELPTIDSDDSFDDVPSELKVPLEESNVEAQDNINDDINLEKENYDLNNSIDEQSAQSEEKKDNEGNQGGLTIQSNEGNVSSTEDESKEVKDNETSTNLSTDAEEKDDLHSEESGSKLPDIPNEYFDLSEIDDQNLYSAEAKEEENVLPELDDNGDNFDSENIWKF